MNFFEKRILKFKNQTYHTFKNTKFSLNPVMYTFYTPFDLKKINEVVGEKVGFFRDFRKYHVLIGYCKGNRLTLFKLSFSARFLTMMRPFRAYLYKDNNGTLIKGNFGFSISTKILTCAWLLNDFIRLLTTLTSPVPADIIGHIVSLLLLPFLLVRMVWSDKRQQQSVLEFVIKELKAVPIKDDENLEKLDTN